MSVKFSLSLMKNPLNPEEKSQYYAKAQVREVIDIYRIAREMAYSSSVTEGDIVHVLRNLPFSISTHLADGDMVDLGDLGRFQFQVKSSGTYTREEFTHHNIKRAKIQFRPGRQLTKALAGLQYEEVLPLKERNEAKRRLKNGEEETQNP